MRFTKHQYEEAIKSLRDGMTQLDPNADNCHVCGDSGHFAGECGHNPLKAMAMCEAISKDADTLHDTLHWFAGYETHMGEPIGPSAVSLPGGEDFGRCESCKTPFTKDTRPVRWADGVMTCEACTEGGDQ